MSNDKENAGADSPEDRDAELLNSIESASEDSAVPGENKSGFGKLIGFLLLAVIIIVAGLAANGQLQSLYQILSGESAQSDSGKQSTPTASGSTDMQANQTNTAETGISSPDKAAGATPESASTESGTAKLSNAGSDNPAADSAIPESIEAGSTAASEHAGTAQTGSTADSSGDLNPDSQADALAKAAEQAQAVANMESRISALRDEVATAESSREQLQQELTRQQQQTLAAQLHWIADPSTRLSQLATAWKQVAAFEGLDEEKRQQATEASALAEQSSADLNGWHTSLSEWINTFAVPAGEDIIPKPDHPSLAWIANQFHLRRAPTSDSVKVAELRNQLQAIDHKLSEEQWPQDSEWRPLRQQLVKQAAINGHDGKLALPDSFAGLAAAVRKLHGTAENWLQGMGEQ